MFGTREAIEAARAVVELRRHYSNPPKTERGLDPILFGYLRGAYPKVSVTRQMQITFSSSMRPSRIDFRVGGTNPTVLEFAVRPADGQQQLNGPQNHQELLKLSKVVPSKAKRRILLLLDLKKTPVQKRALKLAYDKLNAGRGRKARHPVTVVYVHTASQYSFCWRPLKRK